MTTPSDTSDLGRLLRAQVDTVQQVLWASAGNGGIVFVNKRFLDYTGLSLREIQSPSLTSVIHPDDLPDYSRSRTAAIETGLEWELEYRLRRQDGTYRWHLGRCVPERNEHGAVTHWFGSATDIHDLKMAQEDLRRNRALMDKEAEERGLAFHAARIGVWDWDLVANRGSWSPEQRRLFGLADDFAGDFERFTEFVHPDDRERVTAFMKGVLADAERTRYDEEFRIVQPDGTQRWLHGRGRIHRDNETGRALHVTGINIDITERKQGEIALTDALKRLSFHVSHSPLGVIEWDDNWRICQWSNQAEQIFGYTAAEMLGVSSADWNHLHPDDFPRVEETTRRMMETGFGVVRCRNFTKGGDTIHCEWYNTAVKNDSGDMVSVLSQVLDVSERIRAESSLAASNTKQTRIAQTLLQSLLLTPPEDAFSGVELGTLYEAARDEAQIGGDFYDAFSFWDNKVCFVVGDVTGKGLSAASFTAEVKYALRAYMYETMDVARSLTLLNRFLCAQREQGDGINERFVAVAVALLDTVTGQGTCALAGMETPLIYRMQTNRVEQLPVYGLVSGAMIETEYEPELFTLNSGDWLTLTTDGITEARNRERQFWEFDGMAQSIEAALRETADIAPQALARRCLSDVKAWSRGKLTDDACILMVRFIGTTK
ncbi:MAG: PAS domain-containing protein [Akkermansiaceae bacterium]|nr:PAS domain-containing protein [Armatimonadota bacterium]